MNATRETLGDEASKKVELVLKNLLPRSSLSSSERKAAAQVYRAASEQTIKLNKEAASRFNHARAQYLEGVRESVPASLRQFMNKGK